MNYIQQASETIYSFILSTSHPAGGLPLGVMITSDKQEETIVQGLSQLLNVFPQGAFYGRGADKGPLIAMTDDSSAERNAFRSVWPNSRLLLCTGFHFLQRKWTYGCTMAKIKLQIKIVDF